MIKSFRCKRTRELFLTGHGRGFLTSFADVALRKLYFLDYAKVIFELKFPLSNRLKKLKGDRDGVYSIRVNKQWRLCFRWSGGDAYDVEIIDYH